MTIQRALIDVGLLAPLPPGLPRRTREEVLAYKNEKQQARRAIQREARLLNQPIPVRPTGRPKKYFTPEEARRAKTMQTKQNIKRARERMIEAILNIPIECVCSSAVSSSVEKSDAASERCASYPHRAAWMEFLTPLCQQGILQPPPTQAALGMA